MPTPPPTLSVIPGLPPMTDVYRTRIERLREEWNPVEAGFTAHSVKRRPLGTWTCPELLADTSVEYDESKSLAYWSEGTWCMLWCAVDQLPEEPEVAFVLIVRSLKLLREAGMRFHPTIMQLPAEIKLEAIKKLNKQETILLMWIQQLRDDIMRRNPDFIPVPKVMDKTEEEAKAAKKAAKKAEKEKKESTNTISPTAAAVKGALNAIGGIGKSFQKLVQPSSRKGSDTDASKYGAVFIDESSPPRSPMPQAESSPEKSEEEDDEDEDDDGYDDEEGDEEHEEEDDSKEVDSKSPSQPTPHSAARTPATPLAPGGSTSSYFPNDKKTSHREPVTPSSATSPLSPTQAPQPQSESQLYRDEKRIRNRALPSVPENEASNAQKPAASPSAPVRKATRSRKPRREPTVDELVSDSTIISPTSTIVSASSNDNDAPPEYDNAWRVGLDLASDFCDFFHENQRPLPAYQPEATNQEVTINFDVVHASPGSMGDRRSLPAQSRPASLHGSRPGTPSSLRIVTQPDEKGSISGDASPSYLSATGVVEDDDDFHSPKTHFSPAGSLSRSSSVKSKNGRLGITEKKQKGGSDIPKDDDEALPQYEEKKKPLEEMSLHELQGQMEDGMAYTLQVIETIVQRIKDENELNGHGMQPVGLLQVITQPAHQSFMRMKTVLMEELSRARHLSNARPPTDVKVPSKTKPGADAVPLATTKSLSVV